MNRIECIFDCVLDFLEMSGQTEYKVFSTMSVDCPFSSEDNGMDRM